MIQPRLVRTCSKHIQLETFVVHVQCFDPEIVDFQGPRGHGASTVARAILHPRQTTEVIAWGEVCLALGDYLNIQACTPVTLGGLGEPS